jgi:hypothetical protein
MHHRLSASRGYLTLMNAPQPATSDLPNRICSNINNYVVRIGAQ